MKVKALLVAVAVTLLAAACENGPGMKQTIGGLGGAAGGGLLGAQFGSGSGKLAATAAGVLIGGLIGSEIGRSMDEVDRMRANDAVQQAKTAPIGETIRWNNPDSGNYGTVTPIRDGTSASGQYCREFQQTIVVGGQVQDGTGIACQQPDGTWRIVK